MLITESGEASIRCPSRVVMNVYPAAAGSRDAIVSTVSVEAVEVEQNAHLNGPFRDDMGVSSNVPVVPVQSTLFPSG